MSIDIILIIIVLGLLILISIISNHINYKLNRIEDKLISIDNNKDIDTNGKDIKVVIYGNGRKVYEWRD